MDHFYLKMKGILLNKVYRFIWMIENKMLNMNFKKFPAKICLGEVLFPAFNKDQKSTSKFKKKTLYISIRHKMFKCSKFVHS